MQVADSGYSGNIYKAGGLRKHASHVLRSLKKLDGQYDFVAVTGKSGMAVAFAALALSKDGFNLVTIRKGESSHGREIEGYTGYGAERYVIIDDIIDSGATITRIHERLASWCSGYRQGSAPTLAGIILYYDDKRYTKALYSFIDPLTDATVEIPCLARKDHF